MKAANEEEKMDMFDFLNTKIFKKRKNLLHHNDVMAWLCVVLANAGQDGESLQQKQSKGTAIKSDNLNIRVCELLQILLSIQVCSTHTKAPYKGGAPV